MSHYLLPCECGRSTPIETAQAGETIDCDCGKKNIAPTMRTIRKLPVAAAPVPTQKRRVWGPAEGVVLLGGVVALVGAGLLGYCLVAAPRLDVDRLSGQFADLAPAETWRIWNMLQHGLPGPASLETATIVREGQGWRQIFTTGWVIVAIGGVILAMGLVYKLTLNAPRARKT